MPRCPYCGPGYNIGDDGCRHTPLKENPMQVNTYIYKPRAVEAVQITKENMIEASMWCSDGSVHTMAAGTPYIAVKVYRPVTDRQARAFIGDWVIKSGTSFKVYTERAFERTFTQENDEAAEQLLREIFSEETLGLGEVDDQEFIDSITETDIKIDYLKGRLEDGSSTDRERSIYQTQLAAITGAKVPTPGNIRKPGN